MKKSIARIIRHSILLASGSISAVAYAQTDPEGAVPGTGDDELVPSGDIVVTAQRRSESLQKVPMSVVVSTGEQLEKLVLTDFKDVQQLTPGLEMTNSDGRRNVATIRGISFEPDSSADPSVDIYFNDIAVDAQTVFGAIYDVGQIEVLRGPQGIFRGRTSPAGAITLSTRRADLDEIEGYVQGSASTRDAYNAQGGVSLPIVPGKLAVRFAGLADFNRAGSVRNIDGRRSSLTTMSGRVSLAFRTSDRFRANLMYQYFYSDQTVWRTLFGPGNQPFAAFGIITPTGPALTLGDRRSIGRTPPRFRNETHLVTLDTEYNLTDNIVWSTNFGYQDTEQTQNYPDLNAEVSVPGFVQTTNLILPPETLTIDSRISSSDAGPFNWMVGGYYQRFHSLSTTFLAESDLFFSTPPAPGVPSLPIPPAFFAPIGAVQFLDIPIKKDAYAAFGSVRYTIDDRLRVEAGLRHTWYEFDQQSFFSFCLPDLSGFCAVDNLAAFGPDIAKRSDKALTGGATVSYDWSPDFTTYAAYGHSYRPPAAQNGAALSGITNPDLLLSKAEKSDAYEIGAKARLLDGRLNLAIDAFYQTYKDYVAYAPGINVRGITGITSIPTATSGDAISKGVEAQLTGRITPDVDLGLGAAYVDAHYDNAEVACNLTDATGAAFIPPGQDFATCLRNDRIAQVPKFSASMNGEARFPIGDLTPFVRGLASYRPGFNSITDNFRYRDITNVSLFLGVRGPDERWEVSGFVKNLLDQARATIVSSQQLQQGTTLDGSTPGAPILSGYRTASVTPPREFGVTARFKW